MLLRILIVIALILVAAIATSAAIAVAPPNGGMTQKSKFIGNRDNSSFRIAIAR
jgi:archaellin